MDEVIQIPKGELISYCICPIGEDDENNRFVAIDDFVVIKKERYEKLIGRSGGLTFSRALEAMRKGLKVCRKGWNSKDCWLSIPLVDGPKVISSRGIWGARNKDSLNENGQNATVMPYITRMDGKGRIVMGWIPTSIDMFSDDWIIVE